MKQLVVLLSLFITTLSVSAQDGFLPMASVEAFKAVLSKESETLNTIESDFVQVKFMELLSESVESRGKFCYKKSGRICLEYQHPVKYLIVMNDGKIKIVSDGKTNLYELGDNKIMKEMNSLISACMTGDLNLLSSEYRLDYKESKDLYWIVVKPLGGAKAYMQEIHIYLDKQDLSVHRLKMIESSSDYTEYLFTNKQKNKEVADEKFSLK